VKFLVRPSLGILTLGVAVAAGVVAMGAAPAMAQAGASSPGVTGETAYVLHDLQCDQHANGVLDITLVNDDPVKGAVFTVATAAKPSQIDVGPRSAHAITMTGLADGPVVVPVMVNGVSSQVSASVACDQPDVAVLAPTIAPSTTAVVSSPPHLALPTHPSVTGQVSGAAMLPSTGSSVRGLIIGGILVAAGIAASLLARRRYS
jgi:LPXTG-motif cell wall-anchored protein